VLAALAKLLRENEELQTWLQDTYFMEDFLDVVVESTTALTIGAAA
jgi:hypothetical protein